MGKELTSAHAWRCLDNLDEGVVIAGADGSVCYSNRAARRLLGLNGQPSSVAGLIDNIAPDEAWADWLQETADVVLATPDGRVRIQSTPLANADLVQLRMTPLPAPDRSDRAGSQVAALARVSHGLNATLHLNDILNLILDEALANSPAGAGQILLRNKGTHTFIIRAERGETRPLPDDLLENIVQSGQNVVAESPPLLASPILYENTVAGVILLFGDGRSFDPSTRSFVQTLATNTAIAIGNERRFRELRQRTGLLQRRAQQIEQFVTSGRALRSDQPLTEVYEELVHAIQESVGFNVVLLSLFDEDDPDGRLRRIAAAGLPLDRLKEMQQSSHSWDTIQQLLKPEYALGGAYFVPWEKDPGLTDVTFYSVRDLYGSTPETLEPSERWDDEDLFFIPLHDSTGRPLGLISLDAPEDGRRPDISVAKALEIFANQTAVVIENARLVSQTIARNQEIRALFDASRAISSTLEPETVLSAMGDHMLQAVNAAGYAVYEWRAADDELRLMVERPSQHETAVPVGGLIEGTAAYDVLHRAEAAVVENGGAPVALLPILIRDEIYGLAAVVADDERRTFSQDELQLLSAFINQASIALENAHLFEDTYQRERFYAALGRVSLAINVTFDLPTVLNLICRESLSIFNLDGAYIWQRQDDALIGAAAHGAGQDQFVGTAVALNQPNVFGVGIARSGEASFINHFRDGGPIRLALPETKPVKAVLGIPLKKEEEIIGVMVLVDQEQPNRFSLRDVEYATTFGVQAAIAIQNARLVTELRELNEQLDERVANRTRALEEESERVRILLSITTELSASLDQDRVLNQALRLVNEFVNATQGVILLIKPDSNELIFRAAFGMGKALPPDGVPSGLKKDEGLAGWMIRNRSSVVVDDTREDSRWLQRPSSHEHRSVLAVPLIASDEVIGVLMLFHRRPDAFTREQLALVEAAAIQVANAINNANLYLLIRDQAERLGSMLREEQIEAAKNEAILQSIADGVLVADAAGRIVLANVPASQILGLSRSELEGKLVRELLGLYGASGDSWIRTIAHWADDAQAIKERSFLSDQIMVEDKVISVHLSPVFAHIFANNQFFGTVSIFRDITKEVEVDRMKSEFVSTVSHELRTPMTSIKGYADLMLMGAAGQLAAAQLRYLTVIKSNADRLHMLVDDLLDISRIETGKTGLELEPVDVGQVVAQVVDGHLNGRIQHQGKPLHVAVDLPPNLPLVQADGQRLTQILTNLLDNAFNYTPQGGDITVDAQQDGRFVAISISDSGIGIAEEDQSKIFDRFFRADNHDVQKVPGTGLGLAIVRSLVEMHGGQISLHSAPGQGSTFTFTLPLEQELAITEKTALPV